MIIRVVKKAYKILKSNERMRIRVILLVAFSVRFLSILPHGNGIVVPYRDQNTYYSLARCIVDDGYLGVPEVPRGPYIEHRQANPHPEGFYPTFHDSISAVWDKQGYLYGMVPWGKPNSFFEPLYPLLSAGMYIIFGDNFFFWRLIHVLLGTLLVYFIYDFSRRAFKDWRVTSISAIWVSLYPHAIFYSWILMSEILLLVLMAMGFWTYIRLTENPNWRWIDQGWRSYPYTCPQ